MKIDVLIMGSSRPQLLKYTVDCFIKNVENISPATEFNWFMHEDSVFPLQSMESIKFAEKHKMKIVHSNPKIGVGPGMHLMFRDHIKADYLFYLQDDWEFERPVELDRLLWVMNRNPQINCVTFNKYRNMKPSHHKGPDGYFKDKDYIFDGIPLTIYPGWQFLPGLWRMSTVKKYWRVRPVRPEGYYQNAFGTHDQRSDREYCEKHVRTYMYGALGDYRYVRHIGGTWRMADWQLKYNANSSVPMPSGIKHTDFMSVERDRAPWLPDLESRPMNTKIRLTEEGRNILETKPENIKEIYKDV